MFALLGGLGPNSEIWRSQSRECSATQFKHEAGEENEEKQKIRVIKGEATSWRSSWAHDVFVASKFRAKVSSFYAMTRQWPMEAVPLFVKGRGMIGWSVTAAVKGGVLPCLSPSSASSGNIALEMCKSVRGRLQGLLHMDFASCEVAAVYVVIGGSPTGRVCRS